MVGIAQDCGGYDFPGPAQRVFKACEPSLPVPRASPYADLHHTAAGSLYGTVRQLRATHRALGRRSLDRRRAAGDAAMTKLPRASRS